MKSRVAIVGISLCVSGAENLCDFQNIIEHGEVTFGDLSSIRKQDVFNRFGKVNILKGSYLSRIDIFDNRYFNIPEAEADRIDPEQRLALEASVRAVHNAGYAVNELKGACVGIFHTVTQSSYKYFYDGQNNQSFASSTPGMFGARIANFFDWRGPVVGVDTSCSSSSTALYYACQSLESLECEMALVVSANLGINIENPDFSTAIISRSETCTPFDEAADGTLGGEGVFCLLLKRLPDAIEAANSIHAVIYGAAVNHNGSRAQNISAPSPNAQSDVIKGAWRDAGIDPGLTNFIEAHGTGTILGDPIEFLGIEQAFKPGHSTRKTVSVSSIKGQIGHLNVTAGLAGIVRAIMALKTKMLFPQAGLKKVNSEILEENTPIIIQRELEYWENDGRQRFAGVSSFGLTGTNVHFVLGEAIEDTPILPTSTGKYLLQLTANSLDQFAGIVNYLDEFLSVNPNVRPQDLSFSVSKTLTDGPYRKLIAFRSIKELLISLRLVKGVAARKTNPKLVIVIPQLWDLNEAEEWVSPNELMAEHFKELQAHYGDGKLINSLLFQLSGIQQLIKATKEPFAVVGLGRGKLLSMLLSGSLSISDTMEIINGTLNFDPALNENALMGFLNSLAGEYVLCVLGNSGRGVELIRQWCAEFHQSSVIFCESELYVYQKAVMQLYDLGIPFHYDSFFVKGKNLGDLYLPIFEGKRFWPETTNFKDLDIRKVTPLPALHVFNNLSDDLISTKIQDIWRSSLKISAWEINDDFFDLGGTSLLGLDILDQIEKCFGIKVGYADIFDYSTVYAQLTLVKDRLKQRVVEQYQENDIQLGETPHLEDDETHSLYAELTQKIAEDRAGIEMLKLKRILVTGATGFLGVYILRSLLLESDCKIVCLVRSDSDDNAFRRLTSHYASYFSLSEFDTARISAISGDICEDGLAMSEFGKALTADTDMVIHAAAKVEHYGHPGLITKVNVGGTANVFNWSKRAGVKYFNHCSTTVIASGSVMGKKEIHFYENNLNVGQNIRSDIYAKSKFEAEEYLMQNNTDMQLNVFRIGNIGGSLSSGQFQKNIESNFLYQSLKLFSDIGCYCHGILPYGFDAMPVDIIASIVVGISLRKNSQLNCFHIQSDAVLNINTIARSLNAHGIFINTVSKDEFLERFRRTTNAPGYLETNFSAALYKWDGGNSNVTKFIVEDKLTRLYLERLNLHFAYNPESYIDKVIEYCLKIGFIAETTISLNVE